MYYSDPRPHPHQGLDPSQPLPDSNFLLNNVRLTLDSQARLNNPGPSTNATMVNRLQTNNATTVVKNVNVDNFKLGNEAGCSSQGKEEEQDMEEGLTEQQVKDINVFLGETTGGAGKVGKDLDLEKMIRNDLKADKDNLAKSQGAAADPEDPFADFETKLNVALPSRKNM